MPRTRRRASPPDPRVEKAASRFWANVRKTRGCWEWTGPARRGGGAARFSWNGEDWSAHRAAWALAERQFPTGGTLWRRCGNPRCVRLDHLRVSGPRAVPRGAAAQALGRRFWEKVEKSRGCWLWRGVTNPNGYGQFRLRGRYVPAQRLAWALTRGPVGPEQLVLLRCGTRGCVRPTHLRLGEHADLHGSGRDRLWSRVKKTRTCWLWQGATLPAGNGVIGWQGRSRLVPRIVWELERGPIPRGLLVFHLCPNPRCVRPGHLRVGTRADLFRHQLAAGRHWSQVHPESHPRGDNHPLQKHPELACRGEDSPRARLTEEAVRDIRRRCGRGGATQRSLGAEYGVHPTTIGQAVRGQTWKHVD
jgi:hypothetical protein